MPHSTRQPDEQDVEFLLSEYLDGSLDARRARRLEQRLAEEPDLREQLRRYGALQVHLDDLADRVPDGADLDAQRAEIRTMLERKLLAAGPVRARRRWRRTLLGPLTAAAAVALVATVGWLAFRSAAPPGPPVVQVEVAPAARPAPQGPEQLAVEIREMDWTEVPLAPEAGEGVHLAGLDELPPGTVYVSVGPADRDSVVESFTPVFAIE